ncbi:hypothetical protein [Halalkalicoccus jeotgali]|uniref:Uncharacterized protein n=1 Tax=Halalkalicoccus jeotgali (strain DSM 18796 / CECT 7217 / JCM 14584 / KCTC 4019 / B3) TaxID=795797 RepID=D8JC52_HALJB|nr:hypothetical protein [Halalkalicoccus jeotgali]ADJ16959.1 hypothetical protein HacjB3_18083 [Halalkalicoccus jeotgali B3]ADJ16990.1 hypothetical protein HacjB3_18238 [Halalkalicoccus jeotgali B3]ELY38605.1 hypothetical protein C497_06684 [Halalkalicoccus jeotgali B3]
MTRRSLANRVGDLEDDQPSEGFQKFVIGGDADEADRKSGFYEWNAERGVYVNEQGVEIAPGKEPGSDLEYKIEYSGTGDE